MKLTKLTLLCCLLILISGSVRAEINPKPFVIPELKEWKGRSGQFIVNPSTRIVVPDANKHLLKIAQMTANDCMTMFGFAPKVISGTARAGDIIFHLKKDKQLGKEGYTIRITDKAVIAAPEPIGVYWSTRTLLQIAEQSTERSLPKGDIRDFPDYAMRGFMIDCARKFIPLHMLQDYLKIMSYYKMNTLQVHLNDNGFKQFFNHDWNKTYAAFRLESTTFPGLTAQDGSYTKQEFIDLQILAEDQFIEIIPEIDAPAHTLAFSHYKPELGSKIYGMDHFDLFNPETYNFMDALYKEYLQGPNPVFRGPRVHIGTDEYSNKDPKVVEKFREFTDRYIRYVESFGKQACVWGALTHARGTTPVKSNNVMMSVWYNGYAEPSDMAKQGYKLISIPDGLVYIVPAAGYYYDYLDTKSLYESWTPATIGNTVFKDLDPVIAGGMFAVWNDHVGNGISTQDIHHRVFPAMQTLAAKMWTGRGTSIPFNAFEQARKRLSEAPGVNDLGRIGLNKGLVYEQASVKPNTQTPHREIGFNYKVSFNIKGADEQKGTELFRSRDAVFYLSDPIRGMIGFARDGYLNTFKYAVKEGQNMELALEGDNKSTRLYIDGKEVENMNTGKIYFNAGKDSMSYVRTLVFPLEKAGNFKSTITNLKVFAK